VTHTREEVELDDIRDAFAAIATARHGIPDIHLSLDDVPVFSSLVKGLDAFNARMQSKNALVTATVALCPSQRCKQYKKHLGPSQRMSLTSLKPMQS
jgi:hypothetical protein